MSMRPDSGGRDFDLLLACARAGSKDDLGHLLMHYRDYLLLSANRGLDRHLSGKVSPSDVVQETFLDAKQGFGTFVGDSELELRAWLGRILSNNLANVGRRYRTAEKRAIHREIPLDSDSAGGSPGSGLAADTPTPSDRVAAGEEEAVLEAAIARLPERSCQVLRLRYHEQLTFPQIGAALGCSGEAARKIWARAVDQLQQHLGTRDHEFSEPHG